MPKLIINAMQNDVQLQDPFPAEGALVISTSPGTPTLTNVTWSQLQRLRPLLASAEAAGQITYTEVATGLDARADEGDLLGLPVIYSLDTSSAPLTAGGAVTGATIYGDNMLAGQTFATYAAAGNVIVFQAVIPGSLSNSLSIEIVDGAGEAVAGPDPDGKITITLNTGVSTYNSLATLVNNDAVVSLSVVVTASTADDALAADQVWLSGGTGDGVSLSIGGQAADILYVDDGECDYNVDLTRQTQDDTAVMEFRSGSKLIRLAVVLA